MADFVPEAPVVEGETLPTPSTDPTTTPTTENKKEWKDCANILQLFKAGYTYYVSEKRNANGITFQYTLEIKNDKQEVYFTGYDANGNDISKTYGLSSGVKKNYVSSEGAAFRFGSENSLAEKIIEFNPHNMQNYIKFSLAKKSS